MYHKVNIVPLLFFFVVTAGYVTLTYAFEFASRRPVTLKQFTVTHHFNKTYRSSVFTHRWKQRHTYKAHIHKVVRLIISMLMTAIFIFLLIPKL